uniref:Transcriptional regulator ATRX homolog n=1 Tax=Saccoglossus kowalevskii TaxID=10224 RepID=A0ABM0MVR1_SACKO|nr:PREDICTED: transcriptional regulator ATRX homolog [Saccoglossus kowalevskii]
MEKGRHVRPKIKFEERVCKKCDTDAVEDEFHFLIDCPSHKNARCQLFGKIAHIHPYFNLMKPDDKKLDRIEKKKHKKKKRKQKNKNDDSSDESDDEVSRKRRKRDKKKRKTSESSEDSSSSDSEMDRKKKKRKEEWIEVTCSPHRRKDDTPTKDLEVTKEKDVDRNGCDRLQISMLMYREA